MTELLARLDDRERLGIKPYGGAGISGEVFNETARIVRGEEWNAHPPT